MPRKALLSKRPTPRARRGGDILALAAGFGALGAGAALIEAALIPGLALVGAAVVVPKVAPRIASMIAPLLRRRAKPSAPPLRRFAITQAAAKTITYRVIVTATDFSWNYFILGEFAAAAGLSTVSLIAGPFFYFVHETAWNGFGGGVMRKLGLWRASAAAAGPPDAKAPAAPQGAFTVDKALAKTVTFRVFATAMEFTTNYVVVRDAGTAVALTAFGFFVGPFIYLGHEKIWDYYGAHTVSAAPASRRLYSQTPRPL